MSSKKWPVRTLLIDNYDSFTYNLYHQIALVNGTAPVVLHNDDPSLSLAFVEQFDNIVISPGPGNPENEADFGFCNEIIAHSTRPILGICLGLQGICCCYGGKLSLAPKQFHGRTCNVTHLNTDVFKGIPSPFSVVRYHSLCISQLPPVLTSTAMSTDGLIMGIAHKTKPQWGVQFHPESICTTFGQNILENFKRLTYDWIKQHQLLRAQPTQSTTVKTQKAPAKTTVQIIGETINADTDITQLFETCFLPAQNAIWLDSNRPGYDTGRYSILCRADGPLGRTVRYNIHMQQLEIMYPGQDKTESIKSSFFAWLKNDLKQFAIEKHNINVPFSMGWVGYLGYELKTEVTQQPSHTSPYPDAYMIFCDRAIVVDHITHRINLLALTTADHISEAKQWFKQTKQRITGIVPQTGMIQTPTLTQPFTLRKNKQTYISAIKQCQHFIRQGESYEICLTNQADAKTTCNPWHIYQKLRNTNPAPYSSFLKFDNLFVLSCSPESFIQISADGHVKSKPIKGTEARAKKTADDEKLKQKLMASEKDIAENLMIVDLVRHDLGKTAVTNSVTVPKLFAIESYQTVHQMVSTITSTLSPKYHAVDCVQAAFPGGSMTGAPKLRTMQLLDDLEGCARGIYSGTIGYFSLDGAVDLNIVIRTLVIQNGHISLGVGGAITALSDPEEEFKETKTKARAFLDLFTYKGDALVDKEFC